MLATIREYGLEVLASSGDMASTLRAHAHYYLRLAEDAEVEIGGPQQAAWLHRLEREHDNLRAVLQWSLEQAGNKEAIERERSMETALRLGGALRSFWVVHGHLSEGRSFLERALAAREGIESSVQAKALIVAGHLAFIQSDYDRAERGDTPGIREQAGHRSRTLPIGSGTLSLSGRPGAGKPSARGMPGAFAGGGLQGGDGGVLLRLRATRAQPGRPGHGTLARREGCGAL